MIHGGQRPTKPSTNNNNSQSFQKLESLGIKVNKDDLTNDQLLRLQQVLGKWENIFSKSSKDLGKTDLVKHKITLTDNKPFKLPYR